MSIGTWLSDLFKKIVAWLKGAEKELHPLIVIAEDLLNALKAFEASPIGQTVEDVIEKYIPASTGLIEAFKLALPGWLKALKLIDDEIGKSLTEQWTDAIKEIYAIEDLHVRSVQLASLKALFTTFIVQNSDKVISPTTPFTINHGILLAIPTHDPNIVG